MSIHRALPWAELCIGLSGLKIMNRCPKTVPYLEKGAFLGSPPFEKGGQGGFVAFLNPPKSPFPKGDLLHIPKGALLHTASLGLHPE
jgi:hypothetical protein